MNPASATKLRTTRTNLALILLFALLLWLPTVDEIFHIDRALAYNEKRLLADLPRFQYDLDGMRNYIDAFQRCFNDHFGFRLRLLRWYNHWNHWLFGNRMGSGVIQGSDGWLFYAKENMVEQYRGVEQFTARDLLEWQQLLERRRDWLAARGARYLFVVAPDKQSIYSERLPSWLAKARPQTKLDQFLDYMRDHSTVDVLDLRATLREARRVAPTYLKTDTHWNLYGGFVASREIIARLSHQRPNLQPLSLGAFELRPQPEGGGDLAAMLGVDAGEIAEDNALRLVPKPDLPALVHNAHSTENSQARDKMILFHDSFGTALQPFLGYHFGQVIYAWQDSLAAGLIEREKPAVVVSEMAERFFNLCSPNELLRTDDLK